MIQDEDTFIASNYIDLEFKYWSKLQDKYNTISKKMQKFSVHMEYTWTYTYILKPIPDRRTRDSITNHTATLINSFSPRTTMEKLEQEKISIEYKPSTYIDGKAPEQLIQTSSMINSHSIGSSGLDTQITHKYNLKYFAPILNILDMQMTLQYSSNIVHHRELHQRKILL